MEVPDLMIEDEDFRPPSEAAVKQKIDEVAWGLRKRQKEDDIRTEKNAHSPTVSQRTQNPEGFYSEDWNEALQEEDEWQTPNKWQRIAQMVFPGRCLEINPVDYGYISTSCMQHQGGKCSVSVE